MFLEALDHKPRENRENQARGHNLYMVYSNLSYI